ncbi:MAG: phosphate ABC transporter permease subunit PstC [Candidatus Odinarchaeia archaeon]
MDKDTSHPFKKKMKKSLTEYIIEKIIFVAGISAVIFVILIFGYLLIEAIPFFFEVNPIEFFFGSRWVPESPTAPVYGLLPPLWGTVFVTIMALSIAIPIGVGSAIYISQVASKKEREILKPLIEILAGIPSIVYGFFALVVLATVVQTVFGEAVVTRLNALNGAIVLAVMALPTIISVSEDALTAIPREYKEASIALGASEWETIKCVTFPAAKPGIITGIMLGFGRAIGETMAVLMATGNSPLIAFNPLQSILTMTALIARDFGEVPIGSTWYHSIFAIALILLVFTIFVNWVATFISERKWGWKIRR